MKYHFIGIKGSGMSSLAQIMYDLGEYVQGSDVEEHLFTQEPLDERRIKILPFDENNIKEDMIIIKGGAFKEDHPEVKKALELGVKIHTYFEMLGELSKMFDSIAICGCHGKTTTTSLLSHVFNNTVGTNYLIGDGTGHANKDNKYFIFEACEHRRNFLNYSPKYIIMTNIELDHVDYYKDLEDIKSAYLEFGNKASKLIIACGDDSNIRSLKFNPEIMYYGINDNNDVVAKNLVLTSGGSSFDVYIKDKLIGHFDLPLFGKHMILNALAVITMSYVSNLDMDEVSGLIRTFKGAKRRFKEKVIDDIVIIDDYAHHPTEVKVTIESARQKYPNKEIVAIFLPHTSSRVKVLYKDFADALNIADKAYVMEIFNDIKKMISGWM
jgi:UDP-N-acetylmuramate--alanine ligase